MGRDRVVRRVASANLKNSPLKLRIAGWDGLSNMWMWSGLSGLGGLGLDKRVLG